MKQAWKCVEKVQKSSENVKKSSNVLVICVYQKWITILEITSVRSSLDLGYKIWIGKPFIDIVFHFENPRLGFSFLLPVSFEII